ncbi:MAG: hypothetical protein Q4F56_01810 [Candidatus Saccharibacteria bacterium]|nr:hypothetical protein [Candidatus Saccharibacteria bacterium]
MNDERKFDPVTPLVKDDVRPGFLGGSGGGEAPSGLEKDEKKRERKLKNGAAADSLKSVEGAAADGVRRAEGGLAGVQSGESEVGGFFRGSGTANAVVKVASRGKAKGFFKKAGPAFSIFFLVFTVGAAVIGSQFFQPFSLIAQFQESFNSMHVSANRRSVAFFKAQMETGRYKNPIRGNSVLGKSLSISDKQKTELAKQGIEYDDDYNGRGQKVLKYEDVDGKQRIVTADNFKDVYATDANFFQKYNAGSMTWRGQFANWYGSVSDKFLMNNNLTRNMWQKYKEKVAKASKEEKAGIDVVKETIGERVKSFEDGGISRVEQATEEDEGTDKVVPKYDEEGNLVLESETSSRTTVDRTSINVSEKLNSISAKMQGGANAACAVLDTIGAISLLVAASEGIQIINITTSYMEAVDKTKAGYGDEAPLNELASTLNTKVENKNVVLESTEPGGGVNGYDDSGGGSFSVNLASSDPIVTNKSAMQSAGVAGLYGNGLVDMNDPSAQSFNLTSSMNKIMGGIGTSVAAFEGCFIGRAVTAGISAALDVAGIIGCATTFWAGGGLCWGMITEYAIGFVATIGVASLLGAIISAITPWVSSALTRDLVSTLGGEDLGNALVSGANTYQGNVHKANGGSLATREQYEKFAVMQQQVIAEDAREERESLSPFDLTSKNTFMGSIMTQLMSFNTSNSLMGALTASGATMASSLTALTPSASAMAAQIAESLPSEEEYAKVCPYLASIGAIGDSYCNPYMVSDVDTMDFDPDDVVNYLYDNGQLGYIKSDGTIVAKDDINIADYAVPASLKEGNDIRLADTSTDDSVVAIVIKKVSRLSDYINYCAERVSAFGIPDQNIINEVQGLSGGVGDTVIGAVPVIGDVVDVYQNAEAENNMGYISGQACVAGGSGEGMGSDVPSWSETKYYQRFVEDQSLAESAGVIEKSAVTAYLDEYYKENPVDNSYEGQLARYSGLDKETVSDVLDVIAYYDFVNNYDASERYAFSVPVVEDKGEVRFENENVMDSGMIALENIIYTDVRNRNFAV